MNMLPLKHAMKMVVFLSVVCAAGGSAAQAAAVTNLTDEAKTLEMETSEGFVPFTIEANRTWRLEKVVTVRYKEREIRIGSQEEWAIWPGGDIGPQRPNARGGKVF